VANTITVKWLALASGRPESSVYKHMEPGADNALPFRTVDATVMGDKQGAGVAIIGALAERWGFTWAWKIVQRGRRPRDMFRQILQTQSAGTESTMLEYAAVQDGRVTPEEMRALEATWAHEDMEREEKREQIRAMARENIEGGQLARARRTIREVEQ